MISLAESDGDVMGTPPGLAGGTDAWLVQVRNDSGYGREPNA